MRAGSGARRQRREWVGGWIATFLVAMPAAGQSCSLLPTDENRLWMGAQVVAGAETTRVATVVGFDLLGRIYLSGGVHWGGFDTGSDGAAGWDISLGMPLGLGALHFCPTVLSTWTRFPFLKRFDSDRGEVRDFRAGVRLPLGGALVRGETREVGWVAAVDVAYRHWTLVGRSIVVDESIHLELDSRLETSAVVEGMTALTLRAGTVGLTLGLASRIMDRRRLLPFVQMSLRVG